MWPAVVWSEDGDMWRAVMWPLVLAVLAHLLWLQYNLRDVPSNCHLPPGSFGLPLIGETIQFVANGRLFARKRLESAGGAIFRTNLLLQPCIVITGADNVRHVLKGEGNTVQHVGPPTARLLFGSGALSNSTGETFRRHKRFIAKAFDFHKMTGYTGAIHDVIRGELSAWCRQGEVRGVRACRRLTFLVTAHVLLGMRVDEQHVNDMSDLFETFMTSFFSFPLALPGTAFSKGLEARKKLLIMLRRYVEVAEESSLLHRLAADISDVDVTCDICLELLFGSYLTVASASCSTLLLLANNHHVTATVRQEVNALSAGERTLTWIDASSLYFTANVVKEVFRCMPPIAGAFRKTLQPFKLEGYDIPAGWLLLYSITDTHETSLTVTDALSFRPERWSMAQSQQSRVTDGQPMRGRDSISVDDDNWYEREVCDSAKSNMNDDMKSDFLPFGTGARKCIGQEFAKLVLKIFTAEVAGNYEWKVKDLHPSITSAPVPFPADGLPLTLKHRPVEQASPSLTNTTGPPINRMVSFNNVLL